MKTIKSNQQKEKKKLKGYKSPNLKKFGKIADITTGGLTGSGDGVSTQRPA